MVAGGLKLFEKSFPNLKEEVVSMTAEGDRVVCEVLETATFTGSLDWPTGAIAHDKQIVYTTIPAFFRVDAQGLIAEQRNIGILRIGFGRSE